ncbi:MFS transporter [Pseudonocardia sichuanensis]
MHGGTASAAVTPAERTNTRRAVTAGAIGTVIEWYDFALYGSAAALVIGPLFFPSQSSTAATLAAFATFAVGFLARPIGGVIVSHLGDRLGRKPALVLTIALMGASTVLIGLLPTYDQIGVWAPILLVLLRILQGFGAGAELAGAITLIAEYTRPDRRAYYTAIPNAATAVGLSLATLSFLVISALPREVMLGWAWRVPFVLSGVIFVIAYIIRNKLTETPEFVAQVQRAEAKGPAKIPVWDLLRERPLAVLLGFLSITGHNANAYVLNTFALSYLTETVELDRSIALTAVLLASLAGIVGAPLFGILADRAGRGAVFIGGAAFVAVFAYPFFFALQSGSPALVIAAMVLGYGVGFGAMAGAQGAFLSELFDTRYRFSGIALTREMNGVLIAGPTPFIATALVAAAGGQPWLVAGYLMLCALVTVVAVAIVEARRARAAVHN